MGDEDRLRFAFTKKEADPEGQETEKEISFLKGYTLFNIEQTTGLPEHLYRIVDPKPFEEVIPDVERFIEALGADVRHGEGRAFYRPSEDFPYPGAFRSGGDYYAPRSTSTATGRGTRRGSTATSRAVSALRPMPPRNS